MRTMFVFFKKNILIYDAISNHRTGNFILELVDSFSRLSKLSNDKMTKVMILSQWNYTIFF